MSPRARAFFYLAAGGFFGPLFAYGCEHGVAVVIICTAGAWLCDVILYCADTEAPNLLGMLRGDR